MGIGVGLSGVERVELKVKEMMLSGKNWKKPKGFLGKERMGIERWGSDREECEWIEMKEEVEGIVEGKVDEVLRSEEWKEVGSDKVEEVIVDSINRGIYEFDKLMNEVEMYKYEERMKEGKFSREDRWIRLNEYKEGDNWISMI